MARFHPFLWLNIVPILIFLYLNQFYIWWILFKALCFRKTHAFCIKVTKYSILSCIPYFSRNILDVLDSNCIERIILGILSFFYFGFYLCLPIIRSVPTVSLFFFYKTKFYKSVWSMDHLYLSCSLFSRIFLWKQSSSAPRRELAMLSICYREKGPLFPG